MLFGFLPENLSCSNWKNDKNLIWALSLNIAKTYLHTLFQIKRYSITTTSEQNFASLLAVFPTINRHVHIYVYIYFRLKISNTHRPVHDAAFSAPLAWPVCVQLFVLCASAWRRAPPRFLLSERVWKISLYSRGQGTAPTPLPPQWNMMILGSPPCRASVTSCCVSIG